MQNSYVADIGDFGKYLLLNILCADNFILGVNWCFVENEMNNDGKFIDYLNNETSVFFKADPFLFTTLKEILVSDKRNLEQVEKSNVLPSKTIFYRNLINSGVARFRWFEVSLQVLDVADIVFFDPDNGIEVDSCGILNERAVKYVFLYEILETYKRNKSIIIYQHVNRSNKLDGQISNRKEQLKSLLNISDCDIDIVYYGKGTGRFYLIVKHPLHIQQLNVNIEKLKQYSQLFELKYEI